MVVILQTNFVYVILNIMFYNYTIRLITKRYNVSSCILLNVFVKIFFKKLSLQQKYVMKENVNNYLVPISVLILIYNNEYRFYLDLL